MFTPGCVAPLHPGRSQETGPANLTACIVQITEQCQLNKCTQQSYRVQYLEVVRLTSSNHAFEHAAAIWRLFMHP